ncbi:hypothetical protein [Natronorubrum sp. FCH18a]|uniref:hypothetical protein n=1 Tax=Natronorubrum sp. FCH18a TaxID=3447018 RepID=UPI003F515268
MTGQGSDDYLTEEYKESLENLADSNSGYSVEDVFEYYLSECEKAQQLAGEGVLLETIRRIAYQQTAEDIN